MGHEEQIIAIGKQNNGYVLSDTLNKMKIPRIYLARMDKKGLLCSVSRGIYLLSDYPEDELYTFRLKHARAVFSRRTALYLNDMTNRQLEQIDADFPAGYNTSKIAAVRCHLVAKSRYELGATELTTPGGNIVKGYGKERCVCDLFRFDDFDSEERAYAIRAYKASGVDYDKLFDFAEKLNVLVQVKSIFEVL